MFHYSSYHFIHYSSCLIHMMLLILCLVCLTVSMYQNLIKWIDLILKTRDWLGVMLKTLDLGPRHMLDWGWPWTHWPLDRLHLIYLLIFWTCDLVILPSCHLVYYSFPCTSHYHIHLFRLAHVRTHMVYSWATKQWDPSLVFVWSCIIWFIHLPYFDLAWSNSI